MSNPFTGRLSSIDEVNALDVNVSRLKDESHPAVFNAALDNLSQIRKALRVISKAARLNDVGARVYYTQTVQWLNGQIPLNVWANLPQINNLDQVDTTIADQFNNHIVNFQNTIQNEVLYQQVQTMIALDGALRSRPYDLLRESLVEEIQDAAATEASTTRQAVQEVRDNAIGDINNLVASSEASIANSAATATQTLTDDKIRALSELRQAQVLTDWSSTYEAIIHELEEKIDGRKYYKGVISHNLKSAVVYWKHVRCSWETDVRELPVKMKWGGRFIIAFLKNIGSFISISYSKLISYRGQRNISFLLLAAISISFVTLSLLGSLNVEGFAQFKLSGDEFWYRKLTIYLPLIIIFGLGYSFAVKNFRIYSNMIDQYKHRRTVAQTAQGVIISLGESSSPEDKKIRDSMTQVAAQALFEHKVTGHLSKKEAESASLLEILKYK